MTGRLLFVAAFAAVGGAVAIWALSRAPGHNPAPPGVAADAQGGGRAPVGVVHEHPVDLPRFESLEFASLRSPEALRAIADALREPSAWANVELSTEDRSELERRALQRLAYVLEGSEDGRRSVAERDGTLADPPASLDSERLARLQRWPDVWRDAPVDPTRVVVRRLDFSSEEAFMRSLTPAGTRSPLSSHIEAPTDDAFCVEIVIPCRPLIDPEGSRRVDAFLGIAFDRPPSTAGPWKPRRITVYTQEHPGGVPILAPPL